MCFHAPVIITGTYHSDLHTSVSLSANYYTLNVVGRQRSHGTGTGTKIRYLINPKIYLSTL